MSVKMNGLSVSGSLFGIVIWADCFVHLKRDILGMIGMDVVMEVVVVEAVDVV